MTFKPILTLVWAALAFFAPLTETFTLMIAFIGFDFFTGVWASFMRAQRAGTPWAFSSEKARETIKKTVLCFMCIILAWLLDVHVITFADLKLANMVTGIICSIEFWSFLENGCDIAPEAKVFKILKVVISKEILKKLPL